MDRERLEAVVTWERLALLFLFLLMPFVEGWSGGRFGGGDLELSWGLIPFYELGGSFSLTLFVINIALLAILSWFVTASLPTPSKVIIGIASFRYFELFLPVVGTALAAAGAGFGIAAISVALFGIEGAIVAQGAQVFVWMGIPREVAISLTARLLVIVATGVITGLIYVMTDKEPTDR